MNNYMDALIVCCTFIVAVFFIYLIFTLIIKKLVKINDNLDKEIDDLNIKYLGSTFKDEDDYDNYLTVNNFIPIKNYESLENNNLISEELQLCQNYLLENPNNMYAFTQRAKLYSLSGEYEKAICDYKILIEMFPDAIKNIAECAIAYAKMYDEKNAVEIVNNAYRNKKLDSSYYLMLGDVYKNLQKYDEAIENLTKAIELAPERIALYKERAELYNLINRLEEYDNDLRMIRKLEKK